MKKESKRAFGRKNVLAGDWKKKNAQFILPTRRRKTTEQSF